MKSATCTQLDAFPPPRVLEVEVPAGSRTQLAASPPSPALRMKPDAGLCALAFTSL